MIIIRHGPRGVKRGHRVLCDNYAC